MVNRSSPAVSDETWNYVRMSTDAGQEDSPTTQGQITDQFMREHQLPTWTRTYYDLAITAATVDKRPGMIAMLADAERLRPACIVFYKLDRAFRNSYEQSAALRRLKKLGIKVLKVRDPNVDGPQGELIDTILGGVNQFEREVTGLRIRDHNLAMAMRGEWPGGGPPYGYRYVQVEAGKSSGAPGGLEPEPLEWAVARQIWDWALAGYRKSEIAELANASGYRRRNGRLWPADLILRVLRSKTYAGYVPYGLHSRRHGRTRKEEAAQWFPGRHRAMVTLEEFTRVQATTNSRIGQRSAHKRSRSELAGLIRCRLCGGPAALGYDSGGHYYKCDLAAHHGTEHGYWSRREWVVHWALQAVLDHVVAELPEAPPADTTDATREGLMRDIDRIKNQLRRQRTLFEVGEYEDDLGEYRRRKRDLEVQLAAKELELARSGPSESELESRWRLLRTWEQLYEAADSVQSRQRVWAAVVERVDVGPDSVRVTLRDFGPSVQRTWEMSLPPKRTRRPGAVSGRGIVRNGYLSRATAKPKAAQTVE